MKPSLESHGNIPPQQRLWPFLRPERRDLAVVLVYSLAIGLLSLAIPVATQALVNTIAFGILVQPLVVLTIAVFVALVFSAVLQTLRASVIELFQQRIFLRISGQVTHRLLKARLETFDRIHGPELVNRFLEVVTVQKAGATLLVDGLSVAMQTLFGMALLALYHPWLLGYDLLLAVGLFVVLGPLGRGAIRTAVEESHAKYDLVAWLEEVARHLPTFKSAGGAALALSRSNALSHTYVQRRQRHFRILLRQIAGCLFLYALASAMLLGLGGWLVIQGQLTLGQLVAAELVVSIVVAGVAKFGKQLESFYDLLAALDKLGHLTDLPQERTTGAIVATPSGPCALNAQNLAFGYPGRDLILRDVSLCVAAGERVALHGRHGSGKTTLFQLLSGMRTPLRGFVEIDGADLRDADLIQLREQMALVSSNEIFIGTVLDNVRLGREYLSVHEVWQALTDAGLAEAVRRLPDGLHTQLATGGLPLSPSQALRLMFARAMVARPRLIFVDEVLDQIEDLQIGGPLVSILFHPEAPWTLIVATERTEIFPLCERVYVLEGGRLVEEARLTPSLRGDQNV